MTTSVLRRDASTMSQRHSRDDQGFILITLGLLIIPIVIFAALAVDISSWYNRASELQRSADSAALAGVVWMPEVATAQSRANDALNRNNITNGTDDVSVTVQPGAAPNSLKVCVTDNSAPQYFAAVFASPQAITRCSTAQYNVPLQLGSPLNFFGGNTVLSGYVAGPQPADAVVAVPSVAAFGSGSNRRYCRVRASYPSGAYVGYWDRTSSTSTNQTQWIFYFGLISGSGMTDCGTPPPPVPDSQTWDGVGSSYRQYCNVRINGNRTTYWDRQSSYGNANGWRYVNRPTSSNNYPTCLYGGAVNSPIPTAKSPGMWAAVLGPSNSRGNGDIYSTSNGDYRPTGYWYSIDIPKSGVVGGVSVQVFDANTNCTTGCRTPMGDNSGPAMAYAVYDGGTTPYDQSDDVKLCDRTIANGSNAAYDVRWFELCNIGSPIAGRRYYVNVRSTSGSNYNGYALRAVAGTYPAACLDTMPVGDVNCYGVPGSVQPALSAYGDMEMYNGIDSGAPTTFFLANVKKIYAGKTLRIKLWDPGDGAGNISVQILKPGPKVSGVPEQGVPFPSCTWVKRDYQNNVVSSPGSNGSGGTLSGAAGCKLFTTISSDMQFQDRWVEFQMVIPEDYDCDESVDPTTDSGSCWWQIRYTTTQSTSDYTTWFADIIGDPVRLTQ